jgi:hypothetical protein
VRIAVGRSCFRYEVFSRSVFASDEMIDGVG